MDLLAWWHERHAAPSASDWQIVSCSDIGGRRNNEDACTHVLLPQQGGVLAAVADGLGGHEAGEIAAQAICSALSAWVELHGQDLCQQPAIAIKQLIADASVDMTRTLLARSLRNSHTTLAVALVTPDSVCTAHVGDSRVYRLNQNQIIWRTSDHSVAQLRVNKGELTEVQARTDPDQCRLLRSLSSEHLSAATFATLTSLQAEESLLLCSDGFWEHIEPEEMIHMCASKELSTAVRYWVQQANQRAGTHGDNVTVLVIRKACVAL